MSQPIKILNVVSCMNRAGSETRIMDIFRGINRSKFVFDFLCLSNKVGDYEDEIKNLGGKIYHISPLSMKNLFSYQNNLNSFFVKHKAEYPIVHSHLSDTSGPVLKAAYKAGFDIRIAHARTSGAKFDWKYPLRSLFKKQTLFYATDFLACSKKAGEWLFGKTMMQTGVAVVLKNAIDAKKFVFDGQKRAEIRLSLGIKDEFVVGHVGRFEYPKNHNFIIDIFYELKKQFPFSVMILVGDGELRRKIEQKIQKLRLNESIIFVGKQDAVEDYYQAFDVFLFPSHYEGLPGSVLEAQAAGLPCLISDSITDEVCITNLVKRIQLKKNAQEWCKSLVEISKVLRQDQFNNIAKAGFDISSTTVLLQHYYEMKVKGIR